MSDDRLSAMTATDMYIQSARNVFAALNYNVWFQHDEDGEFRIHTVSKWAEQVIADALGGNLSIPHRLIRTYDARMGTLQLGGLPTPSNPANNTLTLHRTGYVFHNNPMPTANLYADIRAIGNGQRYEAQWPSVPTPPLTPPATIRSGRPPLKRLIDGPSQPPPSTGRATPSAINGATVQGGSAPDPQYDGAQHPMVFAPPQKRHCAAEQGRPEAAEMGQRFTPEPLEAATMPVTGDLPFANRTSPSNAQVPGPNPVDHVNRRYDDHPVHTSRTQMCTVSSPVRFLNADLVKIT